ncbi:MAG: sulfotransferase, partial [Alphaproteobacteria bacterium]|nr:sulfotransferase [Alphaproteobacteria bacterium]
DYLGRVERFKRDLPLNPDSYLELRYEALVRSPTAQMATVLDFLGEDWEDAVSQFAGKAEEHDRVLSLTGHSSTTLQQIAQPLSGDRIGLGRQSLSDDEMDRARTVIAARGLADLFARIESETDVAP